MCVSKGQAFSGSSLERLLSDLEESNHQSPGKTGAMPNNATRLLRNTLSNLPYSRSAYSAIHRHSLTKTSQRWLAAGAKHHDLGYSLDPREGHISTVYDLSNIVCASAHPKNRVRHLNAYFTKLRDSYSPVITISNAVKYELMKYYGIDKSRIQVTHLAASNAFCPRSITACRTTLENYSLTYKRYILCVATLEPRKNLARVLDAYSALDPETQAEYPLAMAGTVGWKSAALAKRAERLHEAGHIKQLGFVPQHDLPILYSGAAAFVYPSLYEGFGLPLLEAMQSGCPSITSNNGALAEVAGDGAILVEPTDVEELAYRLQQVLSDTDLQDNTRQLGLQRAKDFTWSKTARETCKVYDRL